MVTANIAQTKIIPVETRLKPYYDDFDEDKNFHRIIFRPGKAVQARELTQLQDILQNQIERFGNHIFQNGSLVLGGAISFDKTATHLNLQSTYANTDIDAVSFTSNTVTYASGNVKVRGYVFGGKNATSTEPPTLILKYFTGDEFAASDTIKTEANSYANVATSNPSGPATLVSINDGIFFINGYFVKVPAQTVVVDKYSDVANAKIGLEYTEDIITEVDDTSLLDPAQESSNYQAPGAARLQINFDLAVRSLDSVDDENFVEVARIEDGEVKKVIQYPIYSQIGDTMARRTYDESGNYTVRPFKINLNDNSSNSSQLQVTLDPGKAYIKGYEYESIAKSRLNLRKARDTAYANGRDLSITFGNYFYVQNVANTLNAASMQMIDLHSVPNTFVTRTGSNAQYASTRVGTARIRELKLYSVANTQDTNTYTYALSVFDTKFANLTSNVSSATSNTVTLYDPTGKYSANDNAYVGSTLRITSGSGTGEGYSITAYNGASKLVNVASSFLNIPTNASNVSIDFQMQSVKSIVAHTYHTNAQGNASANIAQISKNANNETFLADTQNGILVYRWGDAFIKAGTMAGSQNYQYYKVFNTTIGASNAAVVAVEANESFAGRADATGISSSTLGAYMVFRKDTGARVRLSSVAISSSPEQATLTSTDLPTGTAVFVYAKVNKNSDNVNVVQKTKTLWVGNTTHKQATTTSITPFGSIIIQDSGSANGQIVISNPSNTPRERMPLYVSDIKKITKIYNLNGSAVPATGSSLTGYSDVTSSYIFDNGQRDSFYDYASLALKPGVGTITGPLIVCYDYYDHTSGTGDGLGYFSVDSYTSPETYEGIPSYTTSAGDIIPLRDAVDFRPRRTNWANTTNYTLSGIRVPVSDTSFQANYQYYLGRKDIVTISTNLDNPFKIIEGVSSKNPTEPTVDENSMVLYKLSLDPYTLGTTNVGVTFVENKRYTMRDIGRLETRIQNLEYYQTLSILEKAADSLKILDSNGLERTKYGILADDFTTHRYGDVYNSDYFVAIDTDIGGMEPSQNPYSIDLYPAANTGARTVESITTLDYTEEAFVTQNVATKFVQVQPYMISQWVGAINMNPPSDNWVETLKAPDVIINDAGQNDSLVANNTTKSNNTIATQAGAWARNFGRRRRR